MVEKWAGTVFDLHGAILHGFEFILHKYDVFAVENVCERRNEPWQLIWGMTFKNFIHGSEY